MTKEEKQNIDLDVLNLFEWLQSGDAQNCVLYLRGDKEYESASMHLKGDVMVLANTIIHIMESNPDFKRFILSVIGSWLSKNPIEEKMFQEGLVLIKKRLV